MEKLSEYDQSRISPTTCLLTLKNIDPIYDCKYVNWQEVG